ncbi:hypothetical protein Moror_10019 [Moniliophthora roreri MCA 2997]|uniref:Uncharacterized protein n=1 Tax=Moniliophthora roreri (strain MCA 2997) TaxID=1381753 RepID=V2Y1R1_MONRO|nr:hypothetical protein Moror_10019 [Moniliophthora roreri MCA 2997]
MIQDLGYTKSMLVALWTQTMLYGMNTVLFIMCVYVLTHDRGKGKGAPINKPLLITAIVLYTLCAAHAINDLGRAIAAFISYENNPGGATAYYVQLWVWSSVLRQAIYVTNNAVADALLVYRLYVVWNFNVKIITGPVIVLLTTTVCGYRAVWGFSNIKQGEDTYAADIYTWGIALFALSLLLNLVVTSAIAGRMWWCGNRMAATLGQKHGRKYSQAMVIIVESGAIYSVCVFIVLITYATKTNGVYIAYDALAQIMGMNPILIIVRVGLGLTAHDTTYQLTVSRNTNTLFNSSGRDGSQRSDALSVQVHRVMQMKADGQEDGEELELSQASKHV